MKSFSRQLFWVGVLFVSSGGFINCKKQELRVFEEAVAKDTAINILWAANTPAIYNMIKLVNNHLIVLDIIPQQAVSIIKQKGYYSGYYGIKEETQQLIFETEKPSLTTHIKINPKA